MKETFKQPGSVGAYLLRLAHSSTRDIYRRPATHVQVPWEVLKEIDFHLCLAMNSWSMLRDCRVSELDQHLRSKANHLKAAYALVNAYRVTGEGGIVKGTR